MYIQGLVPRASTGLPSRACARTRRTPTASGVLNLANPVAAQAISNPTALRLSNRQLQRIDLTETWRATDTVNIISNYMRGRTGIGLANNGTTTPNPGFNYVHLNNRSLDMGNCRRIAARRFQSDGGRPGQRGSAGRR